MQASTHTIEHKEPITTENNKQIRTGVELLYKHKVYHNDVTHQYKWKQQ